MKRGIRGLSLLSLIIMSCLGFLLWGQPVAAATIHARPVVLLSAQTELPDISDEIVCPEFDQKIDLNNANIMAFQDCQGFYPNLAMLIIQNGPYEKVEDVLAIPGLSDRQKALLRAHFKNFTVTEAVVPLEQRMPPRPAMGKFVR